MFGFTKKISHFVKSKPGRFKKLKPVANTVRYVIELARLSYPVRLQFLARKDLRGKKNGTRRASKPGTNRAWE